MPPSPSRVRAGRSRDPLESAIEAALHPGRFVSERAGFAFVSDLDEVAGDLARLVESEPQRSVAPYEAFNGHLRPATDGHHRPCEPGHLIGSASQR